MHVEPFVALLREMAGLGSRPSVADLSQLIMRKGWSPAGFSSLPEPRKFEKAGLLASIVRVGEEVGIDVVFSQAWGDDSDDEDFGELERLESAQISQYRDVLRDISIGLGVALHASKSIEWDGWGLDFIECSHATTGHCQTIVGVTGGDVDLPVLILARARWIQERGVADQARNAT